MNSRARKKFTHNQPFQQTCDDSASTTCDEFVKMRTNNNTTLFSRDRRLIERCSLKWRRGRSQSIDAFMHRVASFLLLSRSCSMQKKLLCNLKAQENGGNVCVWIWMWVTMSTQITYFETCSFASSPFYYSSFESADSAVAGVWWLTEGVNHWSRSNESNMGATRAKIGSGS